MPEYKLGRGTALAALRYHGRTLTHEGCITLSKNDAAALRKLGYDIATCKKGAHKKGVNDAAQDVQEEEDTKEQEEGKAEIAPSIEE